MAPAKRRGSRWADLPQELGETILRRLPLEDHLPFGLVCKSWWSAMISVRSLFKPPPLLILKPGNQLILHLDDPRSRALDSRVTRFYSLCGGGKHCNLPMIRPNPFKIRPGAPAARAAGKQIGPHRRCSGRSKARAKAKSLADFAPAARCFGSSMGWLFMMDINDEFRVYLLNPISAEKVELPSLPPYVSLWNSDESLCSNSASDQDCIVAMLGAMLDPRASRYHITVLLTCRPKDDNEWMEIRYRSCVDTFALYDGRLYVISGSGQEMDIYDFDPDPRKIGSAIIDDGICRSTVAGHMLLAVMDGKLLLVCGTRTGPRLVYEFVVNRWAKIQTLSEWVLLMNRHTSQAFSTKESPTLGFQANCIYEPSLYSIVVYSMEDASSMTIPLPRPEAGSKNIIHSTYYGGYEFRAYWFLAQSCSLASTGFSTTRIRFLNKQLTIIVIQI